MCNNNIVPGIKGSASIHLVGSVDDLQRCRRTCSWWRRPNEIRFCNNVFRRLMSVHLCLLAWYAVHMRIFDEISWKFRRNCRKITCSSSRFLSDSSLSEASNWHIVTKKFIKNTYIFVKNVKLQRCNTWLILDWYNPFSHAKSGPKFKFSIMIFMSFNGMRWCSITQSKAWEISQKTRFTYDDLQRCKNHLVVHGIDSYRFFEPVTRSVSVFEV